MVAIINVHAVDNSNHKNIAQNLTHTRALQLTTFTLMYKSHLHNMLSFQHSFLVGYFFSLSLPFRSSLALYFRTHQMFTCTIVQKRVRYVKNIFSQQLPMPLNNLNGFNNKAIALHKVFFCSVVVDVGGVVAAFAVIANKRKENNKTIFSHVL